MLTLDDVARYVRRNFWHKRDDIFLSPGARLRHDGLFAEIHVHDAGAGAQSIPTGATYTKLTGFSENGPSSNVTPDATNDKITITKPGFYFVQGSFSFTCGTNNVVWTVAAFLNAVEQDNVHFVRKVGTAGDVGAASMSGFIDVTTADWDVDIRARHDNGSSVDFTLQYSNVSVQYVGET